MKTKQTRLIKKLLANKGLIQEGVWLITAAEMIQDQATWPDEDPSKTTDFTTSRWWIITDNGIDPIGIDYDEELDL